MTVSYIRVLTWDTVYSRQEDFPYSLRDDRKCDDGRRLPDSTSLRLLSHLLSDAGHSVQRLVDFSRPSPSYAGRYALT